MSAYPPLVCVPTYATLVTRSNGRRRSSVTFHWCSRARSTCVGIRRAHVHATRQQHAAAAQVRDGDRRNALLQRADVVDAGGELAVRDRRRIEATQRTRPRQRVDGDAVAGAEHRVVVDAVGGADARRDVDGLALDADVARVAAAVADEDVPGAVVETLDAAVGAGHRRVELEPEPAVERELVVHLPAVADVHAVLPLARGHLLGLHALAVRGRQAEQERRVAVEATDRLIARRAGDVAAEGEPAARTEAADLRLPVVHLEVVEVVADAQFVMAGHLGERLRERVHRRRVEVRVPGREVADVAVTEP